ncbi:MAG: MFS transporter [Deltaproteobacteria bacterium]|nr:MFS transporter [Deltaproteobacteria bacterium]
MSAPDSSQGPPDLSRLSRVVRENPHFRRLYAANAISQVGDWLSIVALYSLVIDLTGKGESVAIALITHLVPAFVFGPTAGVLADRVSRRTMMITADLLRAALVLCFLFVKGPDDIWFAFGVMTLHSIASAFFEPAQQATFPNLVPEKDLALAGTLENSLWSVSLAVGSMLGGLVIAAVGRNVVFVLDAITFLASAWLIRGLPDRYAYAQKSDASRRAEAELREANQLQSGSAIANLLGLSELREGFRYVLREGRVAAIILVKASFGLTLGGVLVLLAFFGEKVFGDGSGGGYAALYTARGVGSFLGPLVAFRIAGDAPITLRRGVAAAFVLVLTAYVAFSVSPTLWIASIALAFGNAGGSILWTYGSALLQRIVPDEVRGRVAATEMAAMTLAMTGSTWLVGVLVDRGVAPRLLMAGCGLVALGPILFWLSVQPRFRAHDLPPLTARDREVTSR